MFLTSTFPCTIRIENPTHHCLYILHIPWKISRVWRSNWLCQNTLLGVHTPNMTSPVTAFQSSGKGFHDTSLGLQSHRAAAYIFSEYRGSWALAGCQNGCFETRRLVCPYLLEQLAKLNLKSPRKVSTMHHVNCKYENSLLIHSQNTVKMSAFGCRNGCVKTGRLVYPYRTDRLAKSHMGAPEKDLTMPHRNCKSKKSLLIYSENTV